MISEAMGKILGMAMAYGVSALGLFLAYANYRKRTLKADKVMTPRAWGVVIAILAAIGGGVLVVAQLAEPPAAAPEEATAEAVDEPGEVAAPAVTRGNDEERDRWPLVGIIAPAAIFLLATWITVGLYHHFTTHGHGGPSADTEHEG